MQGSSLAFLFIFVTCSCRPAEAAPPQETDIVSAVMPKVREDFEAFHRHPELGKKELETSKRIRARLTGMGFKAFESVNGLPTAVIAVLDSGKPGPTIAFRAELDARKGDEATGLPYASKIRDPNLMHSCGHDAHAAILLGTAQVLVGQKATLSGRVVFVFQPAEETPGGADDIVADGVLKRLGVQAIFALHSAPGLPVGQVQLSPGPILAGSSYFTVKISGRGSHAAAPFEGDDVVAGAARLAVDLTTFPARHLDLIAHPAIVSVTNFQAGDGKSLNVLPTDAMFQGTIRSFDAIDAPIDGKDSLRAQLTSFLEREAKAHGYTMTLEIRNGPPPTVNHEALFRSVTANLEWPTPIRAQLRGMFAEDFAFYTPQHPSLYFSLGVAKDNLGFEPVHTNRFSVHPDALAVGVRLFVKIALAAPQSLKSLPTNSPRARDASRRDRWHHPPAPWCLDAAGRQEPSTSWTASSRVSASCSSIATRGREGLAEAPGA